MTADTARNGDSMDVTMNECFCRSIVSPVGDLLPGFGAVFERYADELEHEAERCTRCSHT